MIKNYNTLRSVFDSIINMERRVRERHQKISEVGNLKITIDGTNETRNMSESPNLH